MKKLWLVMILVVLLVSAASTVVIADNGRMEDGQYIYLPLIVSGDAVYPTPTEEQPPSYPTPTPGD